MPPTIKPTSAMPPPVYTSHHVGGEEKAIPPMMKPIVMIVTAIHDTGRPWNDSCASAAACPRGDSSGAGPIDSGATALAAARDPDCSVICDPLVAPPRDEARHGLGHILLWEEHVGSGGPQHTTIMPR